MSAFEYNVYPKILYQYWHKEIEWESVFLELMLISMPLCIYIYRSTVDSESAYISVKMSASLLMLPCFENCLTLFYQEKMAHNQHVLYQLLKALWCACLTLQPIKLVGEKLTPDRTTMGGSSYREGVKVWSKRGQYVS